MANWKRQSRREDGWPTRGDIRFDTDAERLCRITLSLVESMGASVALTNAVVALDRARNYIADHVEGVAPEDSHPRPAVTQPEPEQRECGFAVCTCSLGNRACPVAGVSTDEADAANWEVTAGGARVLGPMDREDAEDAAARWNAAYPSPHVEFVAGAAPLQQQQCSHSVHDTHDDQRIGKVPGGSGRFSHWEPCPGLAGDSDYTPKESNE